MSEFGDHPNDALIMIGIPCLLLGAIVSLISILGFSPHETKDDFLVAIGWYFIGGYVTLLYFFGKEGSD